MPEMGMLPKAELAAKIGFGVSAGCWAALASAITGVALAHPKEPLLAQPMPSVLLLGLGMGVVVSVVVHVGCRVIRNQRRILAALDSDRRDPDPGRALSEQIAGLDPEMIELARTLSERLNRAS